MGFKAEPAAWVAVISAAIAVGVGFGLPVSPEQVGLIMAVSGRPVGAGVS